MLAWLKRKFDARPAPSRIRAAPGGKTDPGGDPRTSGGWEVISGTLQARGYGGGSPLWRPLSKQELELKYQQQSIVHACVRFLCLALQEAPQRVGRRVPLGWEDLPGHPVEKLLEAPNPEMHSSEYLWHVCSHLLLTGESYVWKWRNRAGDVAELWPLPSSWVAPQRDATGNIDRYEIFQGSGKPALSVPKRDVFRAIFPNPSDPYSGLAPLQAAQRDVQTDEERTDYFIEMLTNSRQPGMILYQSDGWSEEEKRDARAMVLNGLGRGHRGKPLFLSGEGAKAEILSGMRELDWPGLSTLSETRICSAFGVAPILVGLRAGLEHATYSNYIEAKRATYQATLRPLWALLDRMHSKGLLRDERPGGSLLEVYSDLAHIPALQEDEDRKSGRAIAQFAAGLITRNEARALISQTADSPRPLGERAD